MNPFEMNRDVLPEPFHQHLPTAQRHAADLTEAATGALRIVEFALAAVTALAVGAAVLHQRRP